MTEDKSHPKPPSAADETIKKLKDGGYKWIDHKPRSAFLQFLLFVVVAAVLVSGVVMMLTPVFECDNCLGVGSFTGEERKMGFGNVYGKEIGDQYDSSVPGWTCEWCSGSGAIPGLHMWNQGSRQNDMDKDVMREILKLRQSTP